MTYSRNITDAMIAHLSGDAQTLASCVAITRLDTTWMGFTSCQVPLVIEGQTYQSVQGVNSSALSCTADTGVDNLEFTGLIGGGGITAADLANGLYDRAAVEMFLVNWDDVLNGGYMMGKVTVLKGVIGDLTQQDGGYTAEIRSLSQLLMQQVGRVSSAMCAVTDFNNSQCLYSTVTGNQVDFTGIVVSAVSTDGLTVTVPCNDDLGGEFTYGLMTVRSGLNNGATRKIKLHTQAAGVATLLIQPPFAYPLYPNDTVNLQRGCNRTWTRCQALGNWYNFRGESYLPGSDQLLQVGTNVAASS